MSRRALANPEFGRGRAPVAERPFWHRSSLSNWHFYCYCSLLLVDDEADFRTATRKALERRGFEVVEAESRKQALDTIRAGDFGLVLLDSRLPGMDGIESLRRIRDVEPGLPVIILTGRGTLNGRNVECDDFGSHCV